MIEFRKIDASDPPVKPEEQAKTYPYWLLTSLRVEAERPNGAVRVRTRMRAYRMTDTGDAEMAPESFGRDRTYERSMDIRDLRQIAEQDASVAGVVDDLLSALETVAKSQGVI